MAAHDGKESDNNDLRSGSTDPETPFQLGEWSVSPHLNRIVGPTGSYSLEPKVMDLLVAMASQPGKVFSRDDLLDLVWGDVVVGEEVLTRAISELRRMLEDDSRVPRYIETIRKRGYRIIAERTAISAAPAAASEPRDGLEESAVRPAVRSRKGTRWLLSRMVVGVAIIAVCVWAYTALRGGGSEPAGEAEPWHPRPLTSYMGNEVTPALSPNGRLVAFSWNGTESDNYDIYVLQIGDASPLRLTEAPSVDIHPVWSPDGMQLAYISDAGPGAEIRVVPVLGGASKRVVEKPQGFGGGFSWSPDGSSIVYTSRVAENAANQLFVFDLESGEERALLEAPASGRGDIEPKYSPDGGAIAFIRCHSSGLQDLWLIPATGGAARCVRKGLLHVMGLEWTRNNREVLCSALIDGSFSLWRIDVASGKTLWSSVLGEDIYTPSIARGVDRLAYHYYRSDRNIWQLGPAEGRDPEVKPVVVSTYWDNEPSVSPSGQLLAFTSTRSGTTEIWVDRLDGSSPTQITAFRAGSVGGLRWAPDGGRIALHASPDGVQEIYLAEIDGGRLQRVASGSDNPFVSDWSQDGRWLYFSEEQDGRWNIWRLDIESHAESLVVQMVVENGIRGLECMDGYFYYARADQAGLWRVPLERLGDTNPPVAADDPWLSDLPRLGSWDSWAICQDRIYLSIPHEQELLVRVHDTGSGRLIEELRLPGPGSSAIALSQDCETCYYVRIEREHGDLMLVDGFQ